MRVDYIQDFVDILADDYIFQLIRKVFVRVKAQGLEINLVPQNTSNSTKSL